MILISCSSVLFNQMTPLPKFSEAPLRYLESLTVCTAGAYEHNFIVWI